MDVDNKEAPSDAQYFDCHLVINRRNFLNSIEQRVFPSGALIDEFDSVGKVVCHSYREEDGAFIACTLNAARRPCIAWGKFDEVQNLVLQDVAQETNFVKVGSDDNFAAAFGTDVALFTVCDDEVREVGRTMGRPSCTVRGLEWSDNIVVYGQPQGEVLIWDIRTPRGEEAFVSNRQGAAVTKIVVKDKSIYVCAPFAEKPLAMWDVRFSRLPMRNYIVPWWGPRMSFDVSVIAGMVVAGVSKNTWLWDCLEGGWPVGRWRFREPVRDVSLVGWRGDTAGVYIDSVIDHYYVPLGGWDPSIDRLYEAGVVE